MEEVIELLNEAAEAIEESADNWKTPNDDLSSKDANELRYIAQMVRLGRLTAAKLVAKNLDTIVRDQIPPIAWPFVGLKPAR